MEKLRLRQSFIKTWCECPLQAKFELESQSSSGIKRQNAAASLGTCVHHALALYDNGLTVDKAIDEFKRVWNDPSLLDAEPNQWPKFSSKDAYKERGVKMITEYHERLQWESREVIKTEHQFAVPFGEFILTGTVDLLEVRKSGKGKTLLRIIDKKTNKKVPTKAMLALDIQFTTYFYASLQEEFWIGYDGIPGMKDGAKLFERFKDIPRVAIWNQLETNKDIDVGPREQLDFDRLYRACSEIKRALEHDVYVPNISGSSCTWCDHHVECGVKIPTQEELDLDDNRWI
jgi:hypothetical protein